MFEARLRLGCVSRARAFEQRLREIDAEIRERLMLTRCNGVDQSAVPTTDVEDLEGPTGSRPRMADRTRPAGPRVAARGVEIVGHLGVEVAVERLELGAGLGVHARFHTIRA